MILVKYRTSDVSYNQYAVVPPLWLSDLLKWLTLSESAEIVSTTYNVDDGPILPRDWPSYRSCADYVRISDLVATARP